jgi:hypothetical protein
VCHAGLVVGAARSGFCLSLVTCHCSSYTARVTRHCSSDSGRRSSPVTAFAMGLDPPQERDEEELSVKRFCGLETRRFGRIAHDIMSYRPRKSS